MISRLVPWLLAFALAVAVGLVPLSAFAASCKEYSITGQYKTKSQAATCAAYGQAVLGSKYQSYEIRNGYICWATGQYTDQYDRVHTVDASGDINEQDSQDCPDDCTGKAKTTQSTGWYDFGTTPNSPPQVIGCTSASCEVVYDGMSASGSALVKGEKHYYGQGSYIYTGASCTPGTGAAAPAAADTVPLDTCPDGSAKGTLNGKVICAPSADTNSMPGGVTQTDKVTTETKPDGTVVKTEVKQQLNSDSSVTTTTTITTTATDGTTSTSVSSSTTGGAGGTAAGSTGSNSGSGSGTDTGGTDPTGCEANPSGSGCGGDGAAVGSLYEKGEQRTWEQVMVQNWQAMQATPIVAALGGFFTVPGMGGSCPVIPLSIPFLKLSAQFDFQCSETGRNILEVFKYCFMFVCAFFAFRLIAE